MDLTPNDWFFEAIRTDKPKNIPSYVEGLPEKYQELYKDIQNKVKNFALSDIRPVSATLMGQSLMSAKYERYDLEDMLRPLLDAVEAEHPLKDSDRDQLIWVINAFHQVNKTEPQKLQDLKNDPEIALLTTIQGQIYKTINNEKEIDPRKSLTKKSTGHPNVNAIAELLIERSPNPNPLGKTKITEILNKALDLKT